MTQSSGRGSGRLAGRRIAVTRPAGQAQGLADAIAAQGGTPVFYPVLEIVGLEDTHALQALAMRLDEFDLAVFISQNAVDKALQVITSLRAWPAHVRVATMGRSSERALQRFGISSVIAPSTRFDSEALVDLHELSAVEVSGKRVVIFRGDGGRELLGDTLVERGAAIEYVTCYHRRRPQLDAAALLRLLERNELDAVTVTSSEGLRNLWEMVGPLGQSRLMDTPLFVPHQRIAEQARKLHIASVVLTDPGDAGLVAGLLAYFGGG
jgi:uroporphyrinogen-III synthase